MSQETNFMALSRITFMVLFLALLIGIADAGAVVNVIISPTGNSGVYTVSAPNIQDASGLEMSFSYDIATLKDPKVTAGSSAAGALMEADTASPGFVRIIIITSGTIKDGVQLATINFTKVGTSTGRLYDLKTSVYSSSSSLVATQGSIGALATTTVDQPGNTNNSTINNTNNNSSSTTSNVTSSSNDITNIVANKILNQQTTGTYLGGVNYPVDTSYVQQQNVTVQLDQKKEEQPRREERKTEPQPAQAQYAAPSATTAYATTTYATTAQSGVDKGTAAVGPGEALARLKSVVSPLERFRAFKGARTIKSLAPLFDTSVAREAGVAQTPAIAISDGKSLLTVRVELAGSGIIPNFSLKGANLKSIKPVTDKAWELGALPQKGKYEVLLSIMIGNEQVGIPLVVIPPLDAAVIKQTYGLSEEGVGALLAKGAKQQSKPVYDLNADGKQDMLDDYVLVAHYLLNLKKQEKPVHQKK